MLLFNLFVYILSFIVIWFGSGLIVSSVDKYSRSLKISSFAFSFFVLGLLTSIPEISVGLNALGENKPEIFVGNLLGGIVVLFLLVIPVLAILGRGINLDHQIQGKSFLAVLAIFTLPSLMVLDKRVSNLEGLLLVASYLIVFYLVQRKRGIIEKIEEVVDGFQQKNILISLLKLFLGVVLVYFASSQIVDKTIYFSETFKISAFLISLLVLSIGTNLPELTIALRSVTKGKKDIAFGDYLGSASANVLLFGIFTILNRGEVLTTNHFLITFMFIVAGLGLFYLLARLNNTISRNSGFLLFGIYLLFLLLELS